MIFAVAIETIIVDTHIDIWSKLVLDIWKEAPEDIAWKRVCRVISDIQMNDIYFERQA